MDMTRVENALKRLFANWSSSRLTGLTARGCGPERRFQTVGCANLPIVLPSFLLISLPPAVPGGATARPPRVLIRVSGRLESCHASVIYSLAKSASTLNHLLNATFLKTTRFQEMGVGRTQRRSDLNRKPAHPGCPAPRSQETRLRNTGRPMRQPA